MIHIPNLISDLGLILGAAGVITLLFKKLRQPVVLGYILAGLIVGPYFHFFPTISDIENIQVWAEIGVIFLLFSLGLEFSFKKLVKVGAPASVTAVVEVVVMVAIGYATGRALGWKTIDSIFLGGILSISSTTIIIRAFEELGMKSQKFVGLVFGVLIVEDLVAIVLLVLLSTLAVSQQFAGTEMVLSILKLVFFLALWFVGGIFLLPSFFKRAKNLFNDETLLVMSTALCLFMVVLATKAGFSPALGAFIMGSLLAETTKAERIEHLVNPVKDFFAAVFFVSVGMLINPAVLIEYALPVLIITIVTILGKALSSTTGALISGQPLKTAVQTGLSLSQIGEFSFIIATLGLTLKVTSPFLYPIAVAVSAITTFTTPYLIRFSPSIYGKLEQILPEKVKLVLNRYSSGAQKISKESDWQKVLRSYMYIIIINGVILIAILLIADRSLTPAVSSYFVNHTFAKVMAAFITLALMSPFLWALGAKRITGPAQASLWVNRTYNRGPLVLLELFRVALVILFAGLMLSQLFSVTVTLAIAIPALLIMLKLFSKNLQKFYARLENRFLTNLNVRENENTVRPPKTLLPWDLHMASFEIRPDAALIGKSLYDLGFREKFGVNIATIERGWLKINAPERNDRLYPGDEIAVIGTDDQLALFKKALDAADSTPGAVQTQEDVSLHQFLIVHGSALHATTIRESGIREKTKGLVVGIERGEERISNPESSERLFAGDILWIVGVKKEVEEFLKVHRSSHVQ
jgi:CPA2 family monovalent cation:H+ antiporter-2